MKIHQVVNLKNKGKYSGWFFCHAEGCTFNGPIEEAIAHTIEQQFTVEYKPQKIKTSWLKGHKDEADNWNSNVGGSKDFK